LSPHKWSGVSSWS